MSLGDAQADEAFEGLGVMRQIARARAMHDAAALDDDRVLGERQRDLGVLLDDQRSSIFTENGLFQGCSQFPTMIGARPSSGSSSSSSAGLVISARAMASICCSPPESWLPKLAFRSFNLGNN